jgi:Mor family transcriptional regulator
MLSGDQVIKVVTEALDKNPELFSFDEIKHETAFYPELLLDLHELFNRVLAQHKLKDESLSFHLIFELMQYGNGIQFYVPKPDFILNAVIKKLIKSEFNGSNYVELARRYQCSTNYVRRLLNETN